MDDKALYQTILGLQSPWRVEAVELQRSELQVLVRVGLGEGATLRCPDCDRVAAGYDQTEERRWRHLDTCQYRTIVTARIPRIRCVEHGVKQVRVPWAEERSRFTALFEAWVIRMLQDCSIGATAELVNASWDEIAGIQRRAVRRGLARREDEPIYAIGVDETSFQKRHEYVTVMVDLDRDRVHWVGNDRKESTLRAGWQTFSTEQLSSVEAIVMDMWDPYIAATRKQIPDWEEKLVFDRYHVMWHVNKAVDEVRRIERRDPKLGQLLKGTKYLWLRGRATRTRKQRLAITPLLKAGRKLGRAWMLKETVAALWDYKTVRGALAFFKNWYGWAMRSRLEPMKRAAKTIKHYLHGVLAYTRHRYTNARTEAMNAKIQEIKYRARGYRNRENFRMAILFHCGGLQMDPC